MVRPKDKAEKEKKKEPKVAPEKEKDKESQPKKKGEGGPQATKEFRDEHTVNMTQLSGILGKAITQAIPMSMIEQISNGKLLLSIVWGGIDGIVRQQVIVQGIQTSRVLDSKGKQKPNKIVIDLFREIETLRKDKHEQKVVDMTKRVRPA